MTRRQEAKLEVTEVKMLRPYFVVTRMDGLRMNASDEQPGLDVFEI